MDIDQKLLISLIHDKPVLWDKTTEEYKNKRLTFEAWRDVCKYIEPNYEELSDEEKNDFGRMIMKKWSNMRDSFIKYHKKINEYKSGSNVKKVSKYKFYDQMQFLKKVVTHHHNQSSTDTSEMEESDSSTKKDTAKRKNSSQKPGPAKKKKAEPNGVEKKFLKYFDAKTSEDKSRSMHFFRGIAPTVDSFNEEDLLDFQFEILKLIKAIKQKKAQ